MSAPQTRQGSYERHCSNCAAYAATTKAGEGRCATHGGAAVNWAQVCDKWKRRG